jgi:C_GCAxxG_C_C family probable redox protein
VRTRDLLEKSGLRQSPLFCHAQHYLESARFEFHSLRVYFGGDAMKNEIAVEKFLSGFNCAQSVVAAFYAECGLDETTALKMACGLGGGMGAKQEVCGAVSGGILVLGLLRASAGQDRESHRLIYGKARQLMEKVADKHGSYLCRELLPGQNLSTEEGVARFRASGMRNSVCAQCVATVAGILEEELKTS